MISANRNSTEVSSANRNSNYHYSASFKNHLKMHHKEILKSVNEDDLCLHKKVGQFMNCDFFHLLSVWEAMHVLLKRTVS